MNRILLLFLLGFGLLYAQRDAFHSTTSGLNPAFKPFYHGVASGDPLADRVIIWTRVTPDSLPSSSIIVNWRVALDTNFTTVVKSGVLLTDSTKDFTVKVDVTGLSPDTYYYYEFSSGGRKSLIGRTRTSTAGACDSLRFAVVSCANYESGYFNVYKVLLARNDFDAVIHLGDYVYEYETGGYAPNPTAGRTWMPTNEIVSLADYRMRYSHYRLDEDLMRLHQQYVWFTVWDDHESANDAWLNGAENHQPGTEGPWNTRKSNAAKAYFEWMPIRQPNPLVPLQLWRSIKWGDLAEFYMLDTRLYARDEQDGTSGSTVTSTSRRLIGADQMDWLTSDMDSTTSRWKILGQQVMMAPLQIFGVGFNGDQWDGYPAERQRIYDFVLTNNVQDMVVITGDIHSSWGNDLPTSSYNSSTGAGSAGVEFVAPSVTSPGISIPLGSAAIMLANSHIKLCDLSQHGFIILDINMNRTQSDWYYISTLDNSSSSFLFSDSWYVNHTERFLRHNGVASFPRPSLTSVPFAPWTPRTILTDIEPLAPVTLLSVYPNPASSLLKCQFYQHKAGWVTGTLTDLNGKILFTDSRVAEAGIGHFQTDLTDLPSGMYILTITVDGSPVSARVIKP